MGTNVRDRERARWLWASATMCFGLLVGYALGSLGNRVAAPIALPAGSLVDIAVTLVAIAAASMVYGVVSDARSAERARRLQVELDRIYAGEPELFESIRTRAANVLMADRGRER